MNQWTIFSERKGVSTRHGIDDDMDSWQMVVVEPPAPPLHLLLWRVIVADIN